MLRPVVCSSVPSRFDLLLVKSSSGVPGFFLRPVPETFLSIFLLRVFQEGSFLMTECPRGQEWPTTLTNFS